MIETENSRRTILWCGVLTLLGIPGISELAAANESRQPLLVGQSLFDSKFLFDGMSLDGWTQRGGKASYRVEDGCIVGTTRPNTPNSFLCTERHYADFRLDLEFKVHPKLNSGIQIRSNSLPHHHGGVVHGYQVEIDPSKRAWSAGIYDESRRGWLDDLSDNEPARQAFRQNEWNHLLIEARGDHIRTWLNGVPAADLLDSETQSGFIGLQVHGTNETDPMEIRWRNIRLHDLGAHDWKPIFDGRTLNGWRALPGGEWSVVDGIIRGTSPASELRHGLLMTEDRYDDFTVRLLFKAQRGNSGFYFRSEPVESAVAIHGFQAEIDPRENVGGLYETGGRGWVAQPDPELVKKALRPDDWNRLTVSAHGDRVVVHLNGHKTAELRDDPGRKVGHLALQLHGGQDMDVEFKAIEVLALERADDSWLALTNDLSAGPPSGARVLLDSTGDLSAWRTETGGPPAWKALKDEPGTIEVVPGSGSLQTQELFRDFMLHVEFAVPSGTGNSGIYLLRRYEVQILDSHGQPASAGGCGAIYRFRAPSVNASRPAGEWQSYDLVFRSPRWSLDGKKIRDARLSVRHNGTWIHHNVRVPHKTGQGDPEAPTLGPIKLQDHGEPLRFRNIWILPL